MKRRVLSAAAIAMVIILGTAWNASAYWLTRTGAQGWTNMESGWKWSKYRVDNISIQLNDTACDNNSVYAYFRVRYNRTTGGYWDTPGRFNKQGCNTTVTWNGLYLNGVNDPIYDVAFYVCTEGVGCSSSGYWDNPSF